MDNFDLRLITTIPNEKCLKIAEKSNKILLNKGEFLMENLKRIHTIWKPALAVLILVGLCLGILSGCGESSLTGTWTLSRVTNGETTVNADDTNKGDFEAPFENELKFNDDGTGTIKVNSAEAQDMTWTQDGDKITISVNTTQTVYTLSGSELTIQDGDTKYFYTKS